MRADAAVAIALTLLGALLAAGCRTVDVNGTVDADPGLQAIVRSAEAGEIAALPEGSAKTLLTERCLLCHGAALIVQQRKDAAAWGRTVTQMRTWGSQIQDEDQAALVAYLAQHFGPGGGVRQQR
jgi:cytochrome c5